MNRFAGLLLLRLWSLLAECGFEMLSTRDLGFAFFFICPDKPLLNALKLFSDIKVPVPGLPPFSITFFEVLKSLVVFISYIFCLITTTVLIRAYL